LTEEETGVETPQEEGLKKVVAELLRNLPELVENPQRRRWLFASLVKS
jgi:hypothetical protein